MSSLREASRDLRRTMGMPLLSFIGLGVSVGMLGDLLLDARPLLPWIDGQVDWPEWITHFVATLAMFSVGWFGATRWWQQRPSRLRVRDILTGDAASPCRWLVFPASMLRGDGPGMEVPILDHHQPLGTLERVFVLHTEDPGGRQAWERIQRVCSERGVPVEPISLPAQAADDPDPVFDAVEELYRRAEADGLADSDVLLDYTGGTKHFTAGLVLAGAQYGRRLQTLKPRSRTSDGYADAPAESRCVEVDLRFEIRGLLPPAS